jgi:hypothetical protein
VEKLLYLEVSEERMEAIRKIIVEILRDSRAKCGLLIDPSGHLLIRKGFTLIREIENLCVLIAAQRATTREIAHILGQDEISVIYHQGSGDHLHTSDVGKIAIFTLLYDDRADLANVQEITARRLPEIARILTESEPAQRSDISRIQNLRSQADKSLDQLLGASPSASRSDRGPTGPV